MPDAITYTTLAHRYFCGNSYRGIPVVVFNGPNGARVVAYCANMNIDIDGDPQAYYRHDDPAHVPLDSLQDGGWLSPTQNAAAKAEFEQLPEQIAGWKAELDALPADASAATKSALEKKIKEGKNRFAHLNRFPANALHKETKFWNWYGLVPLTPGEAARLGQVVTGETVGRHPRLAREFADGEQFEDVYGKYPIIQSAFEPGRGFYFVSRLSTTVNHEFPYWDQRHYLLPSALHVEPYGAISDYLKQGPANLDLNHHLLGLRLDNGNSVTMRYLDGAGAVYKVGECSLTAYTALGGTVPTHGFPIANLVANNFLVLYIGVPVEQETDIRTTFANFSQAPNANDFPVMLAFVAEETVRATGSNTPGNQLISITGNPMTSFENWLKLPAARRFYPNSYDQVLAYLITQGYTLSPGEQFPHQPPPAPPAPSPRLFPAGRL
jgi:hypothetical protein